MLILLQGSIYFSNLDTVSLAGFIFRGESNTLIFSTLLTIGWNLLFSIPYKGFSTSKISSLYECSG